MSKTDKTFDDLSDEELKESCKQMDSKSLATRVAVWRHLGLQKRLAIQCMEELSERREAGDNFDYELHIQNKLQQFPAATIDPKQRSILASLLKDGLKSYGS